MATFRVRSADGDERSVDETNVAAAEKDGYLPVVSKDNDSRRVPYGKLSMAAKDGYKPTVIDAPAAVPAKAPSAGIIGDAVLHPLDTAESLNAGAGQVGRGIPVLGPAAAKAGSGFAAFLTKITPDGMLPEGLRGKSMGELYDYYEAQDKAEQKQVHAAHPVASGVGEMAGALATPVPFGKTAGVAGAAARVASNTGMAAADAALRDQDPAKAAELTGGITAGLEAIPYVGKAASWVGKKSARILADVPEKAVERYIARPEAVNAAKPLAEQTKTFLDSAEDVGRGLSADSSAAFDILRAHGRTTPEPFMSPITDAAAHLEHLGNFGPERKSAVKYLEALAGDISEHAAGNGGMLTLDKGKSLLNVLDAKIQQVEKNGADAQVLKALSKARQTIDGYLKEEVPMYAEHMAQLAGDTGTLKDLTDKFRTDEGAMGTLKRIQQGRAPFAKDALDAFDTKFGTSHGEDLADAWTKGQFAKDTTNGSRRTMLGGAVGKLAGFVGEDAGKVVGAAVDKFGGQAVKAVLDAGIKLESLGGTKYLNVIMDAAKRGPAAVNATHQFLKMKYPDYAETQK